MKKLILTSALSLFMGIGLILADDNHGCFKAADMAANHVAALMEDQGMKLSYEQEHQVFEMYFDACMAEQ